jgi:hypothetical protein
MLAGIQIIAGGQLDWSIQPQTVGKILLVALKSQPLTGIPERPSLVMKYRSYLLNYTLLLERIRFIKFFMCRLIYR